MTRAEYARRQSENRIYLDAVGRAPGTKWDLVRAFFMEHGFAERVLRTRLGLPTPLNTTDRIVMERDIFPEYARDASIKRMLFVGCGRYTAHYQQQLIPDKDFWTIEPDPAAAGFGAEQHKNTPHKKHKQQKPAGQIDLII